MQQQSDDDDALARLIYPRPRPTDYLHLVLITGGMVTVTAFASYAVKLTLDTPLLVAPLLPTAAFVALVNRSDLPAIPEGSRRSTVALTVALLFTAGLLNASAAG